MIQRVGGLCAFTLVGGHGQPGYTSICPTARSRVALLPKADAGCYAVAWECETKMRRDAEADLMFSPGMALLTPTEMSEITE